jgi:HD-GYP domain-containing protein (c-di-GMP phosphodiesterase class II)
MSQLTAAQMALRLDQLTELSVELSKNRDVPVLLERILNSAKTMTNADGGTLYRITPDGQRLSFTISMNDTLGMYLGGSKGAPITIPDIALRDAEGNPNLTAVSTYAANTGESVNIVDVYQADQFNFSGMRKFDEQYNYKSQSFLTVPMQDHEGELIGVLQLINAREDDGKTTRPFNETDQRLIEALASQAAIAITKQDLIVRLEILFESLIKLINIGIDEKSPHTGKHCEQVPLLTMMLAEAANESDDGIFKEFKMTDKDRHELWIAGLLHDCGKIATPVHVVEKATKLQTLFDRIHMVDTRFEVLKRDMQIKAMQAKYESGAPFDPERHALIDMKLEAELAQADADRNFLRFANVGGEAMKPDDQERVKKIAAYRWVGPDGEEADFLSGDELNNLMIRAGTLNNDERQIINNHIVTTIKMLDSLPWPKHLQRVPEYAGGHHEKMDGTGYPKKLRGDQMSLPARMMAVADIFEALTSRDRPYKVGKTLTESLDILGGFATRGHIDPDLFNLFVEKKVYLDYAHKFMDKSQIDDVDESKIPGYRMAAA